MKATTTEPVKTEMNRLRTIFFVIMARAKASKGGAMLHTLPPVPLKFRGKG